MQVLNEFTVTARSATKLNLGAQPEQEWLNHWLLFSVAPVTVETFLAALAIHHRYQISQWDALILASAREHYCVVVYSEDLTHGQEYDGVKVINPFL